MRPGVTESRYKISCFPRVSGDAPCHQQIEKWVQEFSPRERGCARLSDLRRDRNDVFPA